MEAFKKLLDKKKSQSGEMSPIHAKAKSSVLQHLMSDMDSMDAGKIKGLKKVTVAAPDKASLEKGLHAATELVQKGPLASMDKDDVADHGTNGEEEHDEMSEEESPEHEASESPEEETAEHKEEQSPEELKAKIADLEKQLMKKHLKL
jgi:hypothetical protein